MPDDPVVAPPSQPRRSHLWLLIISWFWVGAPLIWGVLQTLKTSMALFR